MTTLKSYRIAELPTGTLFFFCDSTLPHGVNALTCFRKTAAGVTNCVTGARDTFSRRRDLLDRSVVTVDDWTNFIAPIKAAFESDALAVIGNILVSYEGFERAGWRVRRSNDYVVAVAPDGREGRFYAPHLLDTRSGLERQAEPIVYRT